MTSFSGQIQFNDKEKTIKWLVAENNHAVETARNSFIAREFFKALNGVTWTRTTGGYIHYMDEYMQDAQVGPNMVDRLGVGTQPEKGWLTEAKKAQKRHATKKTR